MIKQSSIILLATVFVHIVCLVYLFCNTLFFYDHPNLLIILPIMHIIICLVIYKKEKAIASVSALIALSIITILLISHTNMKLIKELDFGEDYVNPKCIKIRDLKNNSNDSAGIIRCYNSIMTDEYFDYIEKELFSDDDGACLLEYNYNNFFFEGNAECFYERICSNYIIEERDRIDYGKNEAFVINFYSENSYIKEFCIKNETEVIYGFFWEDIDKEDLLKKIEEFYF